MSSTLTSALARIQRAAIEAPYTSEPQTALEQTLLSTMTENLSEGTRLVGLQFVDYAGSPGGRECRFQTSNVFESGWRLCQQLEQLGFNRVWETELVRPKSEQVVSVQYQKENIAVWLIAHTISLSIVTFESDLTRQ